MSIYSVRSNMESQIGAPEVSETQQNGYHIPQQNVVSSQQNRYDYQPHPSDSIADIVKSPPRILDSPQNFYDSPSHSFDSPKIPYDDTSSVSSFKSDDSRGFGQYGYRSSPSQTTPEHQRYSQQGRFHLFLFLLAISFSIIRFYSRQLKFRVHLKTTLLCILFCCVKMKFSLLITWPKSDIFCSMTQYDNVFTHLISIGHLAVWCSKTIPI